MPRVLANDNPFQRGGCWERPPIWGVKLATNRVMGDARAELLRRFLEVARQANITNISEGQTLGDWAKRMGAE